MKPDPSSSIPASRENTEATPEVNEDFTIAQLVAESLIREEPDRQVFSKIVGSGELAIQTSKAGGFLQRYGHLNPGDFHEEAGKDWRDAFAALNQE